MNVPSEASGQTRVLSANALETTMKTIPIRDVCANQLDKGVVEEVSSTAGRRKNGKNRYFSVKKREKLMGNQEITGFFIEKIDFCRKIDKIPILP